MNLQKNRLVIFLFLLLLLIGNVNSSAQAANLHRTQKINGMSFLGPESPSLSIDMFERLKITQATWVALIPEAKLNRRTLELIPDSKNSRWGETIAAQIEGIHLAKAAGLKVMLKPHIILEKKENQQSSFIQKIFTSDKDDKTSGASWRGDFKAKNESDWQTWEKSYETYILRLARIADSLDVELFCIGTELREFVVTRPQFWKQLIQKVRNIYMSQMTYSANWDEYDKVTFWGDLDFIGIDTYFPINFSKTPSIKKTMKNWKSIKRKLKAISKKENRKILMTEFGYRNVSYAGAMPWVHDHGKSTINNQAQLNLYKAFFETYWDEPWVAGGFSWNWLHTPQKEGNTDFSIENKPAMKVIERWYGVVYN